MRHFESIPKFVIESPERRFSFIGEQLRGLGIQYFSIGATFYDQFPENFDKDESWAKSKRHLSLPELGTATSHRHCYEKMIASEFSCALIFEDDCQINNIETFELALENLAQMDHNKAFVVSFFSKVAYLNDSDQYGGHLYSVVSEPSHAVCYYISNPGAKALSHANRNLTYVADWPKNSGVQFYLSKENFITTDLAESLISNNRGSTNISSLKRLSIMISVFSGIHFFWYRKHFRSFREFKSILITPTLKRKMFGLFSTPAPNYGNRVRVKRRRTPK